jgi:hypothetical protein
MHLATSPSRQAPTHFTDEARKEKDHPEVAIDVDAPRGAFKDYGLGTERFADLH